MEFTWKFKFYSLDAIHSSPRNLKTLVTRPTLTFLCKVRFHKTTTQMEPAIVEMHAESYTANFLASYVNNKSYFYLAQSISDMGDISSKWRHGWQWRHQLCNSFALSSIDFTSGMVFV